MPRLTPCCNARPPRSCTPPNSPGCAPATRSPRPPGWQLSLRAVRAFLLGDAALGVEAKIVLPVASVERMLVTLATGRGLMLVGEPGTAKSMLSELLAAAVSGTSTLTIQGGASLTEDQIRYGWNYALLINEGPSPRALVPAPLYQGMRDGRLVRFEEITRTPLEGVSFSSANSMAWM